jgi:hypothetical protein
MLKTVKKPTTTNYFDIYIGENVQNIDIDHYFNINEETKLINYKLIVNDADYYSCSIDFEKLKESAYWSDQNLFGVHLDNIEKLKISNKLVLECIYADSMISQLRLADPNFGYQFSPFYVFVPSKDSSINDLIWVIPTSNGVSSDEVARPPINVAVTGPSAQGVVLSEQPEFINNNLISTITVSGPASIETNSTFTLNLSVSDTSIKEIFVDAISGTTNKTRVYLTNGTGSLQVSTAGLTTTDNVKIKFGYKYFTGVTTYTKVIS